MTGTAVIRTLVLSPANAGQRGRTEQLGPTKEGTTTMYSKPTIVAVEKIEAKAVRRGSRGSYGSGPRRNRR